VRATQASKSHEYPVAEMESVPVGQHRRTMILCKVARGKECKTEKNMDKLPTAPEGYDSVHGVATPDGPLNFDELVVYDERAILPYALVIETPVAVSTLFRTPGSDGAQDLGTWLLVPLVACIGGIMAFALIFVEMQLVKATSSLAVSVIGNVKDAIQVFLAITIGSVCISHGAKAAVVDTTSGLCTLGEGMSLMKIVGIIITISGATSYVASSVLLLSCSLLSSLFYFVGRLRSRGSPRLPPPAAPLAQVRRVQGTGEGACYRRTVGAGANG